MSAIAAGLHAVTVPDDDRSPAAAKTYRHPDLYFATVYQEPERLSAATASDAHRSLSALGIAAESARVDPRSGRWGTLLLAEPLLPGTAAGNNQVVQSTRRETR